MMRPTLAQLRKLVGIANYQFGQNAGSALFERKIMIECSRRTGRIRHIYHEGELIATLRPKDGNLALTPGGASILLSKIKNFRNLVVVEDDFSEAIIVGGDVFAKHVLQAHGDLRPAEEVIVTNQSGDLLGVGKAILNGKEMRYFKRGVAVKLRRGVKQAVTAPET